MRFRLNLKELVFWKVNSAGVKRFVVSVLLCIFPILCFALILLDKESKLIAFDRQVLVVLYSLGYTFVFCTLSVVLKLLDERYGKKFFFQLAGLLVWAFVAFEIIWHVKTIEFLFPLPALFVYFFLWVALYWKEEDDLRLSVFFCRFVEEFLKRLIVLLLFFLLFFVGIVEVNVKVLLFCVGVILVLLSYSFLHISFVCSIPSKEELFDGDAPLKDASFPFSVIFSVVAPVMFFYICLVNIDSYLDGLCNFLIPLPYLLFFFIRTISCFPRLLKGENGTLYLIMYGLAWVANVLMSYIIFKDMSEYVSEVILFALLANIVCYILLILLRTPLKRFWVTIFFSSFILVPIFLYGPWSFSNIEKRITEDRVISSIKECGLEYPLKSENDVKIWKYSMSEEDREMMNLILNRYDHEYEMSDLMEVRLKNKYVKLKNDERDNKEIYLYENWKGEIQIPKGFSRFCPDEIEQSVHLNKEDVNGEKTTEIMLDIEVLGTLHEIYIPMDTALYYGSMNLDEAWDHEFWVKDKIIHEGEEVKFCLLIKEFGFEIYKEEVTDYSVRGRLFLE